MSNDLLKEAIADAKAVRETALANAKIALEEAFTPKLQSMLSAKIQNEAEEIEEEEEIEETEETSPYAGEQDLATEEEGEEEASETYEDDEDLSTDEPAAEEMPTDEPAAEEMPADVGEEEEVAEDEEEEGMEEDLELEAIIRELEDELEEDEEEAPVEEVTDSSDIGAGDNKVDAADGGDQEDPDSVAKPEDLTEEEGEMEETEELEEEVDLEEIIRSLQEEDEVEEDEDTTEESVEVVETLKSDLKEAYDVVRFLKGKINEVNLLNGKLLFTNKLFKAYSLSEGQKLKVIETFDRAKNIREVKLVYSTLAESMNSTASTRNVKTIKEGMASKPTASTKPSKATKILNEGEDMANRFKKLAGLIN
jgi:hypothetical protein